MAEKDQEFLEFVVRGLVEHPDEVKINRTVDEMGVLLTLDLNGEDMGKVIGRCFFPLRMSLVSMHKVMIAVDV